jgi:hypothetical protein
MTAALLSLLAQAEAALAAGDSDSRWVEIIVFARSELRKLEN